VKKKEGGERLGGEQKRRGERLLERILNLTEVEVERKCGKAD
jgi:hypothetical protein